MTTTTTITKDEQKAERAWRKTMADAKPFVSSAEFAARQTPSIIGEYLLRRLVRDADDNIASGQKQIAEFAARLATADPANAFEWSRDVFDAAGTVRAAQTILAIIADRPVDDYAGWSDMRLVRYLERRLNDDVVRAAQYPERSTSAQSNEIARSIASAKAKILAGLQMNMAGCGLLARG